MNIRQGGRKQSILSGFLLFGMLACGLVISSHLSSRWDLTEEREFSLAPATVDLVEQLEDRLQLKLYFNRELEGAEQLLPLRVVLEDLLSEIQIIGGDKISIETVDPTQDMATASQAERAGISALQIPLQGVSRSSVVTVWQGLEMRYQDRSEVIPFLVPTEFEFAFASKVGNLLKPERSRIGFFSREPALPPKVPGMDIPIPEGRIFEELRQILGQRFIVDDLNPQDGDALAKISALVVARPENVSSEELAGIQSYLASGGHVLVLADAFATNVNTLDRREIDSGIDAWLNSYGIYVDSEMVWEDEAGFALELPPQVVELPDGRRMSVPKTASYGPWPVLPDSVLRDLHPVVSALTNIHLLWAHPVRLHQIPDNLSGELMLQSTASARRIPKDSDILPTLEQIEKLRNQALTLGTAEKIPLAVSVAGSFGDEATAAGQLVVLGDADLFTNTGIAFMPISGNRDFAANLFDWLCQESALIGLRTRGGRERRLKNFLLESVKAQGGLSSDLPQAEIEAIEATARAHQRSMRRLISWGNVLLPLVALALAALMHFAWHRRRARNNPYLGERSE